MLVARLLKELDAELERLQKARQTIVALIAAPSSAREPSVTAPRSSGVASTADMPATEALLAVPPVEGARDLTQGSQVLPVAPARRRGRPRGSLNVRTSVKRAAEARQPEPTALSRAISLKPVFVPAAELAGRRNAVMAAEAEPVTPTASGGTLESLIREVEERRSAMAA